VDNTSPAFNGLHLKHMKAEIDMLKERERLHTHQYNNLTTDNVVELMVDQLAKQYPDVKHAQAALTAMSRNLEALRETNKNEVELLRENISGIQASLASVHGKLKDSMSDATQRIGRAEDVIGKAEEEITNVRNELSKLASKVDLHARAVEFGQTQFEQTSKDLKQAKMDVSAMESGLTALREIIIKRNDGLTNGTT
jgi:chromosome segregation ATPase